MQIEKMYDELCDYFQQQKKKFVEMNVCATKTHNGLRWCQLIDEFNELNKKILSLGERMQTLRNKNLDEMKLCLLQNK